LRVATFFFLLALGKKWVRPHANEQGPPTDTLHPPTYVFFSSFRLHALFFHDFCENVLPAEAGSTILKIDTRIFNEKSHFFGVEATQIEPVLIMFVGLIA